MTVDPQTLIMHLPLLLSVVLAVVVALVLLRHGARLRTALEQEQREHNAARSELLSAQERLSAANAAAERQRSESAERITELGRRVETLLAGAETANQKIIALESGKAAQAAQLARVPELAGELELARKRHEETAAALSRLESEYAALTTQAREQQQAAAEKIRLLEQAETRLTKEFENLANRIFEEKQKTFSESSRTSVEALLNPVRQQLVDFRKKVEDIYDNENKDRASLRAEITHLKTLNERISTDALNLTNALKGDSKLRGSWGEIQLERLLEQSGLVKGREYEVQGSFRSEEGQRYQPDVIIHLPDSKDVIVDSKVSLVAYEQYHAASDDGERARLAARHVDSVRSHVNDLAGKSYDELIGLNSLDLVIMFVPIEPALLLAYEHQLDLHEQAFKKNIMLVSPSTLMLALQVIHNIWRYEYQKKNTQEIARQGGDLYDRFVNFVTSLDKVGDALTRARSEFDTAHKRLATGKGNLIGRAEKLRELGIKTKKALPEQHLHEAGLDDNDDDEVAALPSLSAADTER